MGEKLSYDPNNFQSGDISQTMKEVGKGIEEAGKEAAFRYFYKWKLAESKGDKDKVDYYRELSLDLAEGIHKKKDAEIVDMYKSYKLPEFQDMCKKAPDGHIMYQEEKSREFKWALLTSPVSNIRDFRNLGDVKIEITPNERIKLFTGNDKSIEQFSYDPKLFILSSVAMIRDEGNGFVVQPYTHIDNKRAIKSQTMLVFSIKQREAIYNYMNNYVKDNL